MYSVQQVRDIKMISRRYHERRYHIWKCVIIRHVTCFSNDYTRKNVNVGGSSVPSDVNRATRLTDRPQGQYDSGDMGADRFKLPGKIYISSWLLARTILHLHPHRFSLPWLSMFLATKQLCVEPPSPDKPFLSSSA